MKMLGVVLAVGLLIGGAMGMAQAQSAGTPPAGTEAYHGSMGPAVSYPPAYYGNTNVNGWTHDEKAGGYVGYPPDYSTTPNTNGWIHGAKSGGYSGYPPDYSTTPNTNGWIHMGQ